MKRKEKKEKKKKKKEGDLAESQTDLKKKKDATDFSHTMIKRVKQSVLNRFVINCCCLFYFIFFGLQINLFFSSNHY